MAWLAIVVPTIVSALLISRFRKGGSLWSLPPTLAAMMLAIALMMAIPHILPVMAQAEYADGEPNFSGL